MRQGTPLLKVIRVFTILIASAAIGTLTTGSPATAQTQSAQDEITTSVQQFQLALPVTCPPSGCHLARTMDHDPTPHRDKDYRCGPRAGNDHKGTDIAVLDMKIARQTTVKAAATGTVIAMRDGMDDLGTRRRPMDQAKGRECGNGVLLSHANGWQTQYCHLGKGTITVRVGQSVITGTSLGTIGMSGYSEFPHLHFAVRHAGTDIDPFSGTTGKQPCDASRKTPLWTAEALAALPYADRGFYHAGGAAEKPTVLAARDGLPRRIAATSPTLFAWAEVFAARAGDRLRLQLFTPSGQSLLDKTLTMHRSRAQWFAYAGVRRPGATWPTGTYRGLATLSGPETRDLPSLEFRLQVE